MSVDTFLGGPQARADYWRVYEASYDALQAATTAEIEGHPVFGPLVRAMPPEVMAAQRQESRRQLEAALVGGGWPAYRAVLQAQGATYARLGVDLASWHDLVRLVTRHLVPPLVEAWRDDPPRLAGALRAMMDFTDMAMVAIGEAYLDERQRLVDEQRRLAEERAEQLTRSAAALRDQARLLDSIVNGLAEAVYVVAPDGTPVLANASAQTLFPSADPAGQGGHHASALFEANGATPLAAGRQPIQRALAGEAVDELELVLRTSADANPVYVIANARPIRDDAGELIAVVLTARDVTEKRRLQAIRDRAAELEAIAERNQEASRLKSEFLANMSHELRTPLNVIIGFSDLLLRREVDPDQPEYEEFLRDVLGSAKHLLQLINDVLDLAKVEAGKLEFRPEPIEPGAMLGQVVHILRGKAAEKGIRLTAEPCADLGEVVADPQRLLQIVYNYVANALKFTAEGGSVTLRARPDGPAAFRVEVQDTGIGIAAADMERLFIEFQQLDAGADKLHAGTGLGLALCRRLAEAQGGSVGVESTVGVGSTFHVTLPRQVTTGAAAESDDLPSAANLVLVVEDNARDLAFFRRTLSDAGYAVQTAVSASQALLRAKEQKYAAIVLDLLLPDGTGMDLLTLLRADGANADTPVVIVSIVPESDLVRAHAIEEWLPKPVAPDTLLAALRRVLAQAGELATPAC